MNESIRLLSSMSPKVDSKHHNFRFKKGTSVLALKKHFRQSSLFHKSIKTARNEDLNILESEGSTLSSESSKSIKIVNETPIVISDSDISEISESENEDSDKSQNFSLRKSRNLSGNRRDEIQNWIENIDRETVTFTDFSTIYGDVENDNFQAKEKGSAVNSTFADGCSKKFNELFKTKNCISSNTAAKKCSIESSPKKMNSRNSITSNHSSNSTSPVNKIIEESLSNESYSEPIESKITFRKPKSYKNVCNDLTAIENEFPASAVSNESLKHTPLQKNNEPDQGSDLESMLDSFYGHKWREKKDLILPATEIKNRKPKLSLITQSERKPKQPLWYKTPNREKETVQPKNLLQNLHISRLKSNLESPMTERWRKLCDSDSETSPEREMVPDARLRLTFNDSDDERAGKKNDRDQPEISDKENFDVSDLGQSLEDRIKKKYLTVFPSDQKLKKSTNKDSQKSTNIKTDTNRKRVMNNTKKLIPGDSKKTDQMLFKDDSTSSDEEWDKEISKINYRTPKTGTYSFLASLSDSVPIMKCDMSARIYRNCFKLLKGELLTKLFKLYNEKIFENAIPEDSIFEWSDKMRSTAGSCYCKKITRRTGAVERSVRIVLASKVIDSPGRLRDTLVHELCHAATWIVNCVSDGHGKYWKSWAYKAMKTFPELPPIKRCHEYGINTKYTYKCTGCGYSIGRHSKSLDIERKRCGYCYGKFEILINKISKKGETVSVPTPRRPANGFALFVKENYGTYKDSNLKHGDVMKLLGQKFQELKVNK